MDLTLSSELRERLQESLGRTYEIERELGGGGMSRVFVANETSLGRKVVVKVLPPGVTGDVNVERFRREIQVSAKLQHPHIVPVLSTGEVDGVPYYTMPFVDGESLRARLIRLGPLPILKARMNPDLHMAEDLKNTGKGNLFVVFGEPDIDLIETEAGEIRVKVNGVDVFDPSTGEIRSDEARADAAFRSLAAQVVAKLPPYVPE